ncbi:uncharacterized protein KD926_009343 [Aspergillus affinis]|uniref:uncharacterized protein n=1 Tax=Aspergillus affinis TaxID=1070780 RepID=UPI0022FEC00D|nr:uncharacterized protein KD926_009343 [Aspergillus affinis]KAI9039469.1 hypothetical protein KD926_009343 [Aspergillus affinis]
MAQDPTPNEPEKASSESTSSYKAQAPNFHPSYITPDTFHRLLNCYPVTVEAIARRKATGRTTRSSAAVAKKARKSKSGASSSSDGDAALTEQERVDRDVQAFLELDEKRYRGLPEIVRDRAGADGGEGGFLTKEELVEIMEWKLCVSLSLSLSVRSLKDQPSLSRKHGVSRPMLLGMIKGNTDDVVEKATANAFAKIPARRRTRYNEFDGTKIEEGGEFPEFCLGMVSRPLRGVGPATASLLLSVATAKRDAVQEVPFYSDDVFLWLCLKEGPGIDRVQGGDEMEGGEESKKRKTKKNPRAGVFKPNGEIDVKYTVQEYRQLWDAVGKLTRRLNILGSSSEPVSCLDVEKAALVLRHIDISGFFETEAEEGSSVGGKRKRNGKTS